MMLSLNQMTTRAWDVPELLTRCAAAGVTSVGLWREPVLEYGLGATVARLDELGIGVSTLCRAGFFPVGDDVAAAKSQRENRAAIDEAAALDAGALVLLGGGLPPGSRDLDGARVAVARGIEQLLPYAAERGVRLGLEPLHPALCADRGVISTLHQALDVVERFPVPDVGVVVDAFHVWWDPQLWDAIARAGDRIFAVQLADHPVTLQDPLNGRLLPGEGVIDLRRFVHAVRAAGYRGAVEVEVFSTHHWSRPPEDVLAEVVCRTVSFLEEVS
jgi:sugar phosphate isomerase/epimerase